MTRATFRVFRTNSGDDPFSATVVVTDLPTAPTAKSDALMTAFSFVKHKPNALKVKKAKKKPAKKKKGK
jgi:hypothetical protein